MTDSVLSAIGRLLDSTDLDDLGEVRATLARALARKLDEAVADSHATSAMAVPGISKELREVLEAIQEASDDAAEYVGGLFSSVGDSALR